jgi:hypothetical protein
MAADLNDYLRKQDSEEARRTLDYLQREISQTQVREMQNIFYRLIEEQTKTLMLARVRPEYALKVVDPPVVPDRPAWPSPLVTAAFGALAGAALTVLRLLRLRRSRIAA